MFGRPQRYSSKLARRLAENYPTHPADVEVLLDHLLKHSKHGQLLLTEVHQLLCRNLEHAESIEDTIDAHKKSDKFTEINPHYPSK